MSRGGHRGQTGASPFDPFAGQTLTSGIANQDRDVGSSSHVAVSNQGLLLTYFRASTSLTAANIRMYSGTTAAGATPTLVKYALFTVASNGDLTRVAITASNTAIFASGNTGYTEALLATVGVVGGRLYASGLLVVTGAALPTVLTPAAVAVGSTGAVRGTAPRLCGVVAAQADIATGYTAAQVTNASSRHYAEILPA